MPEAGTRGGGGHGVEALADGVHQRIDRARRDRAQMGLELAEDQFDLHDYLLSISYLPQPSLAHETGLRNSLPTFATSE